MDGLDPFGMEINNLRSRLTDALEALEAIRSGDVDALVVYRDGKEDVYTLEGADQPYRVMLEEINEGAATLSKDGTVLWGNKYLSELLGLPLVQLIGSPLIDFLQPESVRQSLLEIFKQSQPAPAKLEAELYTLNGLPRKAVLLSVTSFRTIGHPASFCVVITDLSDQRRSAEVVAAEQLASAIIEQAAEPVVVCDLNGVVIRASQAAAHLAGQDPVGQPFEHAFPLRFPDSDPNANPSFSIQGLLAGERFQGVEACLAPGASRSTCSEVSLLVSGRPLCLPDEEPIGCVISLTDLTTRKQAEEELRRSELALRHSEGRFRIALGNTPISVFTTDTELRYTWIYFGQQGQTIPRLIGLRDDEIAGAGDVSELIRAKKSVLETGRQFKGEISASYRGQTHKFILTVEALRDGNGEIVGLTGAALDVTEQRRMEAAELEYQAQLEVHRSLLKHREAERVKLARDLHDSVLQELIVANMGISEVMLIEDPDLRMNRLRWVQGMVQKQVTEIRQFCRELRPPTLAPFGLQKAIESHVDSLRESNPDLLIDLNLMKDGKLLSEEIRLELYRIYQELANNVIRHSEAEHLVVTFDLEDDVLILELWDDGKGFNVPTDWVVQSRSGHLGLIGIRERAAMLSGTFTIQSEPQGGTRARLTIPHRQLNARIFDLP